MTCVHSPASPDATGCPSRGPLAPEDWGEVESTAPPLSPGLLPAFINGCSLFRPVSRFGCDITAHFSDLVENPHLTHQELGLIDKEVWRLHQPRKSLPSPPRCSGGWKFLMKVSIHKPEAVSVGTPGPGSATAVQKYCRAWSWAQNQWIESKLCYLWVMIPSQCVRNVVLCVWKRERLILKLGSWAWGSCASKGAGLASRQETQGRSDVTDRVQGGLDNSVAGLTLFPLRFRKIVSLSSPSYCTTFIRPVCLAFPLFLFLVCCYICGKNSCAMFWLL